MRGIGARFCLRLLAAGLCLLSGCFGVTANPRYFPYLLPTEDIIQTHAKPISPGYYANFDKHAIRLEVRPLDAINPVRTQQVLIATVYDEKGNPRRDRRVEWMVEGVGNIIEVDESGIYPGRGYKVDNKYAVSYTAYHEHRITRGNSDPNDDFVIRPGQSWCVVSAEAEGDTYVCVLAPEIYNWDARKVVVTRHWVDAEWQFPAAAVNRAGSEHLLTTNVFRHTDRQPLANYRVRYRILDGPPAVFLPSRTPEAIATSDISGNATARLVQVAPQPGINHISVEIIRPPDPTAPSGVGIIVGSGQTTKQWQAAQVGLTLASPPSAPAGQEIPYTITVNNAGQVEVQAMTLRDIVPDGAEFVRAEPRPVIEGNQLIWAFGVLPPGQAHAVHLWLRALRAGALTNCASVTTVEGLRDEKCVTTQITEPSTLPTPPGAIPPQAPGTQPNVPGIPLQPIPSPTPRLTVDMKEPASGSVGVPMTFQITVGNSGTAPATNVLLSATFDRALEHETHANPVELAIGALGAGENKSVSLVLTPRTAGRFSTRVVATADGGLRADIERSVTVRAAQITIAKTGPRTRYVDQTATWDITVTNSGDLPINNVIIRDQLPAEVAFMNATGLGQQVSGQVVWNLGALAAREQKVVQLTAVCRQVTPRALNIAVVTADPGLEERAEAPLEIRAVPAYGLDVQKTGDPVQVGGRITYTVIVTNTGSLPGTQIEVRAVMPKELQVVNTDGPAKARQDGNSVIFPIVDSLPPKQTLTYTIDAQALQPGDVRVRVELRTATLRDPLIKEQSTTIFVGNGQAKP
jgi:uncharacterized repeat protein (TIGR01451 family)